MTDTPVLTVDGLSVAFGKGDQSVTVVDDVSFSIQPGRTLGLVGESGSGKSMTSLSIMGLTPDDARVSGSITFKGEELLTMPQKRLRALRGDRMAMIFQDPMSSLNPYYTVGFQIVEAYRAHRKATFKEARDLTLDVMERVRIPEPVRRFEQYPHEFSGGMRQRIMIAMAMMCEPELIIADEPTTALDVTVQARVLDLLGELQEEFSMSMLFITHDLAVVSNIADDIIVMRNGRIVERGTVEQVFSDPKHEYTQQLLRATPRID